MMVEFLGFIGVLFSVGVIYQFICAKKNKIIYPPRGEIVNMDNGKSIHIMFKQLYDSQPTIILEAGNGLSSSSWMLVQPEIEKFANCLSYDRIGLGWSNQNHEPSTSLNDVKNLHILLTKLKIPKPYILVGHSYGGLLNLLYANQYPNEIAGIILVDPYHEDQRNIIPLPSSFTMKILRIFNFFGIFRLLINILFPLPNSMPLQMKKRIQSEITAYSWVPSMSNIFLHAEESITPLKNLNILNKPLVVISAGLYSKSELKYKDRLCKLQKDFLSRSSHSNQIIADKSYHNIPFSQPEVIVAAVKEMVYNTSNI